MVTDGSADLTKEQAIESLGAAASRFVVVTWGKEGAMAPVTYVAGMTGVT